MKYPPRTKGAAPGKEGGPQKTYDMWTVAHVIPSDKPRIGGPQ